MNAKYVLLFSLSIILLSCSGDVGKDMPQTTKASLPGTWTVVYNNVIDECELLPEGALGVNDQHTLTVTGSTVTVNSQNLPTGSYVGVFRSEEDSSLSFLTEASLEGDLFGDGIFCLLSEQLAYNDITNQSANTIYTIRLSCEDGFVCDSIVRGVAQYAE